MAKEKDRKLMVVSSRDDDRLTAYCADPILYLLLDRLHLPPVILPLVVAAIISALEIAWAAPNRILVGPGDTVGLLDDPAYYYSTWLGGFSLWLYYAWLPGGTRRMFHALVANRVVRLDKRRGQQTWQEFMKQVRRILGSPWLSLTNFLLSILLALFVYLPSARYVHPLGSRSLIPLVLITLWMVGTLYCTLQIVLRQIIVTALLSRLFKLFELDILPLHPDRAGGLAPLGSFALKSTYLIAIVGFIIVFAAFNRQYQATGNFGAIRVTAELIPAAIVYVCLAPVSFLAPLSTAHRAMKEAKDEALLDLSRAFEEVYQRVQTSLSKTDGTTSLELTRLKDLHELHQLTDKFPIWPFNAETLRRFFASVLSPIALALLPTLIAEILKLL